MVRNHSSQPRGSVLVFALVVMTILLVSAIAVATVALTEKRSAFATQKSVLAFQAADSGSERVLKRIYQNNSPLIASIPLNGNMQNTTLNPNGNSTISNLIGSLANVTSTGCSAGVITATNSANPPYQFQITFYEQASTTPISCSDTSWRDKVVKIKAEGFYRGTSRVIEVGIRPRE